MKTYTEAELNEILRNHIHWILEDVDGWGEMRADLRGANLRSKPVRSKSARSKSVRSKSVRSKSVWSKFERNMPVWSKPARSKPARSKSARSKLERNMPARSRPVRSRFVRSKPVRRKNMKIYCVFTCDVWKSRDSMSLCTACTSASVLREVLAAGIRAESFEFDDAATAAESATKFKAKVGRKFGWRLYSLECC